MLASFAYTFNSKGQREQVEERIAGQIVRTIAYTYDAADRLIEEQMADTVTGARTITYTYDPVGNRLTKHDNGVMTTYTYDDNDRLLIETPLPGGAGGGLINYTYDNNGNMLSKAGNGEQMNLTYNALNQLIHTEMTITTGSTTMDYVYDHDGIRVGKTINGTDVFKYVVDTNRPYAQVLEEQRTQGALSATTNYIYGDDLLSRTTDGITHYYQYDGLGSTRALSDASGTLTDTYQYDAYGMLLGSSGNTINPYLYRGEQYDPALSAYYLRARYYQPGIGRFLTTDPVEGFVTNPFSQQRYIYGNSEPINTVDPSGKVSLKELLVGTVMTNVLLGIAVDTNFMGLQDVYATFAQKLLPDAFIVGVNTGVLSVDLTFLNLLGALFGGGGGYFSFNAFGGQGLELLVSISSAEIGLFETRYAGKEFGHGLSPISLTFELYNGSVYNLWNVDDYEGPFEAYTFGFGSWGRQLFWDGERVFNGPWGIANTIWSKPFGFNTNKINVSGAYAEIDYKKVTTRAKLSSQAEAVFLILDIILLEKLFIEKANAANPYNFFRSMIEATVWVQTGVAKYYWSKREPRYNVNERQNEGRPYEFRSGPSYVFLGGWN